MNRVFNQLFKLPMEFVMAGMDLMLNTMRQFQATVNDAADLTVNPRTDSSTPANYLPVANETAANPSDDHETLNIQERKKEPKMYDDQYKDLGGNDIKYVSYSILFKKRDYEATLKPETEEVVDYSTDGASYGAVKISEYTDEFGKDAHIPIPAAWKGNEPRDDGYGFHDYGGQRAFKNIPAKDRKHIRFVYRVKERLEKEASAYDRDQVEAIRDVKKAIDHIWD
ncbi:MAG TPA: hypothetical protein VMM76_23965 [Pirellulaceae bacterium]|nr:hypothetical protein [Pirellulaceae bacterium]